MTMTKRNLVTDGQIPGGIYAFDQLILAMQEDLRAIGNITQDNELTEFPPVPEFGGVLPTRKGAYEGVWTDDPTPLPRWRRLSDSTLYSEGQAIPITL